MRDQFRGYYPPTSDEFKEMWSSGVIVLDTNALLNLYRYSNETRRDFLLVLNKLKDRLWIPAQVGLEFQIRRLGVINDQKATYGQISKALETSRNVFEGKVKEFKNHSTLDAGALLSQYGAAMDALAAELTRQEAAQPPHADRGFPNDDIWESVTNLFAGRVGEPYSETDLAALYVDGKTRYAKGTPPGYKDSSKGEPGKYGDLVLWKQLLDRAGEEKDSAIFVTADSKEDWWRIEQGQRLGPRAELVDEYFAKSGKRIHFYSPEQFLRQAQSMISVAVSTRSLDEVGDVSAQSLDKVRGAAEQRLRDLQGMRASAMRVLDRSNGAPADRHWGHGPDQLLRSREETFAEWSRMASAREELMRAHPSLSASGADHDEELVGMLEHLSSRAEVLRARLAQIDHQLFETENDSPRNQYAQEQVEILDREIELVQDLLMDLS